MARLVGLQENLWARFPRLPSYIAVSRLNRPIGIYLLLWPTLTGLWFAADGWPGWHLLLVFLVGVLLTRSAGCVINDIADRNFDSEVKRTLDRPLARGDLSIEASVIFAAVLAFIALVVVLTTNWLTVGLAFLAALVAAVYPLMKRYTYLPQVVLGIAFSFGIPMAFAAFTGSIPVLAWLLATANVVWTVAYDTEYAMVDRDDDIRLGLKSSAILFGEMDRLIIGVLQVLFIVILLLVGRQAEVGSTYYLGLAVASGLLIYQQYLLKERARDDCFIAFLNNHWVGLAIFSGVVLDFWLH